MFSKKKKKNLVNKQEGEQNIKGSKIQRSEISVEWRYFPELLFRNFRYNILYSKR